MSLLRRLGGIIPNNKRRGPGPDATPSQRLDFLEGEREEAEAKLLKKHRNCPECESTYLRVGAWASTTRAGWTVTCVNCGHVLERTVELKA